MSSPSKSDGTRQSRRRSSQQWSTISIAGSVAPPKATRTGGGFDNTLSMSVELSSPNRVKTLPALRPPVKGLTMTTPTTTSEAKSKSKSRKDAAAALALRRLNRQRNCDLGHEVRSQPNSFSNVEFLDGAIRPDSDVLDLRKLKGEISATDALALKAALSAHKHITTIIMKEDNPSSAVVGAERTQHIESLSGSLQLTEQSDRFDASRQLLPAVAIAAKSTHTVRVFNQQKRFDALLSAARENPRLVNVWLTRHDCAGDPDVEQPSGTTNSALLKYGLRGEALYEQLERNREAIASNTMRLELRQTLRDVQQRHQQEEDELKNFFLWENSQRLAIMEAQKDRWKVLKRTAQDNMQRTLFALHLEYEIQAASMAIVSEEAQRREAIASSWFFCALDIALEDHVVPLEAIGRAAYVSERAAHINDIKRTKKLDEVHCLYLIRTRLTEAQYQRRAVEDEEVLIRASVAVQQRIAWRLLNLRSDGRLRTLRQQMRRKSSQLGRRTSFIAFHEKRRSLSKSTSATEGIDGDAAGSETPTNNDASETQPSTRSRSNTMWDAVSLTELRRLRLMYKTGRAELENTFVAERDQQMAALTQLGRTIEDYGNLLHWTIRQFMTLRQTHERLLQQAQNTLTTTPSMSYKQYCLYFIERGSSASVCAGLSIPLYLDEYRKELQQLWSDIKENQTTMAAQIFDFNAQKTMIEKSLNDTVAATGILQHTYALPQLNLTRPPNVDYDDLINAKVYFRAVRLELIVKRNDSSEAPAHGWVKEPKNVNAHDRFSVSFLPRVRWWGSDGAKGHDGGKHETSKKLCFTAVFPELTHVDFITEMLQSIHYHSTDLSSTCYTRNMFLRISFSPSEIPVGHDAAAVWHDGVIAERCITVLRWPSYLTTERTHFELTEFTDYGESRLLVGPHIADAPVVERDNAYYQVLDPKTVHSVIAASVNTGNSVVALPVWFVACTFHFAHGYSLQDQLVFTPDDEWGLIWNTSGKQEILYRGDTLATVVKGHIWIPAWCNQQKTALLSDVNDEIVLDLKRPTTVGTNIGAIQINEIIPSAVWSDMLSRFILVNKSPAPEVGRRDVDITLHDSFGNSGTIRISADVKAYDIPAELSVDTAPRVVYLYHVPTSDRLRKYHTLGLAVCRFDDIVDPDTESFVGGYLRIKLLEHTKYDHLFVTDGNGLSFDSSDGDHGHVVVKYLETPIGSLQGTTSSGDSFTEVSRHAKSWNVQATTTKEVVVKFSDSGDATIAAARCLLRQVMFYSTRGDKNTKPVKIEVFFNAGTPRTKIDEDGKVVRLVDPADTIVNKCTSEVLVLSHAEPTLLTSRPNNEMVVTSSGTHLLGITMDASSLPRSGSVHVEWDIIENAEATDCVFPREGPSTLWSIVTEEQYRSRKTAFEARQLKLASPESTVDTLSSEEEEDDIDSPIDIFSSTEGGEVNAFDATNNEDDTFLQLTTSSSRVDSAGRARSVYRGLCAERPFRDADRTYDRRRREELSPLGQLPGVAPGQMSVLYLMHKGGNRPSSAGGRFHEDVIAKCTTNGVHTQMEIYNPAMARAILSSLCISFQAEDVQSVFKIVRLRVQTSSSEQQLIMGVCREMTSITLPVGSFLLPSIQYRQSASRGRQLLVFPLGTVHLHRRLPAVLPDGSKLCIEVRDPGSGKSGDDAQPTDSLDLWHSDITPNPFDMAFGDALDTFMGYVAHLRHFPSVNGEAHAELAQYWRDPRNRTSHFTLRGNKLMFSAEVFSSSLSASGNSDDASSSGESSMCSVGTVTQDDGIMTFVLKGPDWTHPRVLHLLSTICYRTTNTSKVGFRIVSVGIRLPNTLPGVRQPKHLGHVTVHVSGLPLAFSGTNSAMGFVRVPPSRFPPRTTSTSAQRAQLQFKSEPFIVGALVDISAHPSDLTVGSISFSVPDKTSARLKLHRDDDDVHFFDVDENHIVHVDGEPLGSVDVSPTHITLKFGGIVTLARLKAFLQHVAFEPRASCSNSLQSDVFGDSDPNGQTFRDAVNAILASNQQAPVGCTHHVKATFSDADAACEVDILICVADKPAEAGAESMGRRKSSVRMLRQRIDSKS